MERKNLKQIATKAFVALIACINLTACNKDDDGPTLSTGNYVLTTTVQGADMTTYATYAQTFDLHSANATLDNSAASEVDAQYNSATFGYNGSVYYSKYSVSKLEKWDADQSGNFSKTADIDFTDLGYQSNLCFWKEDIAFTGGPNLFKVAIFNPSTMTRTGFIDMTAYSKLDLETNFPSEGDKIGIQSPSEMIIRDNYMYVAIYYCKSGTGDWLPSLNSCQIIVIDLDKVDPSSSDNSAAVVKEISDPRGSFTGAWASGGGSSFMILDEKNDIYVLCHNMWANYGAVTGLPACALRIKDGETDFDKNYYFDMESATNGANHPIIGFEYAGNGKLFASAQDPSAIDPDNAWSYYLDPIYQWYQFDLYSTTAKKVSDTYTKGAEASKAYFEDGYAYLPMITKDEAYIMRVNTQSLASEKLFTTVGDPLILKIK